ncbi:MAG: heparinase [Paenibacillus sp.]|nr:heparinase [Paenibacillus sp.]
MITQTSSTLYPVLIAYSEASKSVPHTQFTIGHTLVAATLSTAIRAYTVGNRIVLEGECKGIHERGTEQVVFLFDPKHHGRRPHNFLKIRWTETDGFMFERFLYEYLSEPLPEGVHGTANMAEGTLKLRLELPLELIGLPTEGSPQGKRWIGFNMYREAMGGGDAGIVKWSGLPCDSIIHGQGLGDLLIARGLDADEVEAAVQAADADSRGLPTRWVKREIPAELFDYITRKRHGMTIRIKAADAERARLKADTTLWGQTLKANIVEVADYWAAKSDDELFELVPVGNPRALTVAQYYGDPARPGNYRTLQTCLERPYEFYNPATGMWWRPGMQLRNPGTGEEVTLLDHGDGFLAPPGFPFPQVRYMFLGAYRLFILGVLMGIPYHQVIEDTDVCPETSGKKYFGAINNLASAFILTGDRRYARKALILIGRIAELVPYMNGNFADGTISDSVHIAEPTTTETSWYDNFFEALDLLYDEIDACAPELAELFGRKLDAEGRARTKCFCVKDTVHELIPYLIYSCEVEIRKTADWSLRYIYKYLTLASFMQSGKLMHRILSEGPHSLQGKLRNLFYRDGRYAYDSYGYLGIIGDQLILMANTNYLFTDEQYYPEPIDMFTDKQYGIQAIIDLTFRTKTGGIIPAFGDWQLDNKEPINEYRRRGLPKYAAGYEIAFSRMGEDRGLLGSLLALYTEEELSAFRLESVNAASIDSSLLLLGTAADYADYQSYASVNPETKEETSGSSFAPFLLQNSETSVLRHGRTAADCKHVVLYGQPTAGHAHGDKLGLWIGAFGYHLLAGVGAYPFTWISPKLRGWETHSAACMVTLIDGRNQNASYSKQLAHYEGHHIQLAGLENDVIYPGSHAERWSWLISAPTQANGDDSAAYVLDINYVRGGLTFDYNTAGMLSPDRLSFQGIEAEDWVPLEGTLQRTLDGTDSPLYEKPGYGWMKAQRKAKTGATSVSWTYRYDHAALKVHTVPDVGHAAREVVFSLGEMGFQHMGESDWLPFVMWRDQEDPIRESEGIRSFENRAATFCTVLEPYDQKPFLEVVGGLTLITANQSTHFQPVGVEVFHGDNYRDILISNYAVGDSVSFQDRTGQMITTDAKALMLRYCGDELVSAEAIAYTHIEAAGLAEQRGSAYLKGKVELAEEKSGTGAIAVRLESGLEEAFGPAADIKELEGRVALIHSSDYPKPSAYYIRNPKLVGDLLSFDTSISLISLNADSPFETKKRELGKKAQILVDGVEVLIDVKPGDSFTLSNHFMV